MTAQHIVHSLLLILAVSLAAGAVKFVTTYVRLTWAARRRGQR